MYQQLKTTDSGECANWVNDTISEWNHSQKNLAEVLDIALAKAKDLAKAKFPADRHMLTQIENTWFNRSNRMWGPYVLGSQGDHAL